MLYLLHCVYLLSFVLFAKLLVVLGSSSLRVALSAVEITSFC